LRQAVADLDGAAGFFDQAAGARYRAGARELRHRAAQEGRPAESPAQCAAAGGDRERLVGPHAVPISGQEAIGVDSKAPAAPAWADAGCHLRAAAGVLSSPDNSSSTASKSLASRKLR